jgi:hypothetical protein
MTDLNQEYKSRLITIITQLKEVGVNDPETVWLIGSLGCDLTDKAGITDWPVFKASLSREAYDGLLQSFDEQLTTLVKDEREKAILAIQALACSVVGRNFSEPSVQQGVALLDDMIGMSMHSAREHRLKTGTNYPNETKH